MFEIYVESFKRSYLKFYKKPIVVTAANALALGRHAKICQEFRITPDEFYDTINDHIIKTGKRVRISLYNREVLARCVKRQEREAPATTDQARPADSMEYYRAQKRILEFRYETDNLFRDYPFIYQVFSRDFLLSDSQFITLLKGRFDFGGFRNDVIEYTR